MRLAGPRRPEWGLRQGGGELVRWFVRSVVAALAGLCVVPALAAAGFETVVHKDGQRIIGEVVAEKPGALYVDLGYDLLRVPRDQVLRRSKAEDAGSSSPFAP